MSAPTFVPEDPTHEPRYYESPQRRPEAWPPDRPGEVVGDEQPRGGLFGNQGPDIGYAYKLVHLVTDRIHLSSGESMHDTERGILAVAMRRASLFGRAPVLADLEIGCTVWGFFNAQPPYELVTARKELFEGASGHHGYHLTRSIAAAVSDDVLSQTPSQISAAHESNWSALLDLELAHPSH